VSILTLADLVVDATKLFTRCRRGVGDTVFRAFTGLTPTQYVEVRRRFLANILATCWMAGRCRSIDFLQDRQLTKR
jgi:hypothetical protein